MSEETKPKTQASSGRAKRFLQSIIIAAAFALAVLGVLRFLTPEIWAQLSPPPVAQHVQPAAALPQAAPRQDTSAADAKISELETRILALEAINETRKNAGADTRLSDIEYAFKQQQDLLEQLKNEVRAGTRQVAVITAFEQMKEAALRGDPFAEPLNRLTKLATDNTEATGLLGKLQEAAQSGIGTQDTLKQSFTRSLNRALYPKQEANPTSFDLSSIVRIRKVGEEQNGTDDEAVLARAEALLNRGDIEKATKELAQLSPPAADSFAGWIKQASTQAETRRLLDLLQVTLLARQAP